MGERVAIIGSRDYPAGHLVRAHIEAMQGDTIIVSGGARGVDTLARQYAAEFGLVCVEFHPAWRRRDGNGTNKAAGFERNRLIVDYADRVVAFWDGNSPGTRSTISLARRAGKPVRIIYPDGRGGLD